MHLGPSNPDRLYGTTAGAPEKSSGDVCACEKQKGTCVSNGALAVRSILSRIKEDVPLIYQRFGLFVISLHAYSMVMDLPHPHPPLPQPQKYNYGGSMKTNAHVRAYHYTRLKYYGTV